MGQGARAGIGAVGLVVIAACTVPDPFAVETLPRGEPLEIRHILAANPNKRACVQYVAASNSCASIITSTVDGNTMISNEMAAINLPSEGRVQQVELVTRSVLEGDLACAQAQDITVTGTDETSLAVMQGARDLVAEFGGRVCGAYFRSGDGYMVSTTGADGRPVPPGDVAFQFITGEAQLRAQ